MTRVTALVLRRLRAPLLALIVTCAIAILGFVLIPGLDDKGNPWRMDFLSAFYVVTYTAPNPNTRANHPHCARNGPHVPRRLQSSQGPRKRRRHGRGPHPA